MKSMEELKKMLGTVVMVESTGYSAAHSGTYEKPLIELHRGIIKDIGLGTKTVGYRFDTSRDNKCCDFGCLTSRNFIMESPLSVRDYSEQKIRSDERFSMITKSKDNVQRGDLYFYITYFAHLGMFHVNIAKVLGETLVNGYELSRSTKST